MNEEEQHKCLVRISKKEEKAFLDFLADNETTDSMREELLKQLEVNFSVVDMRNVVCEAIRTAHSDRFRENFVDDEDPGVHWAVIRFAQTNELLAKFVNDEDLWVRKAVAQYAQTDELRAKLVDNENYGVRNTISNRSKKSNLLLQQDLSNLITKIKKEHYDKELEL